MSRLPDRYSRKMPIHPYFKRKISVKSMVLLSLSTVPKSRDDIIEEVREVYPTFHRMALNYNLCSLRRERWMILEDLDACLYIGSETHKRLVRKLFRQLRAGLTIQL